MESHELGAAARPEAARAMTPGSYEEFVAARSRSLLKLAYLLAGTPHDAEDLLQTTLLKVFVHWRKASVVDSVDAYTRRIMVNAFLSGRRRGQHRREELVTAPPELVADEAALADRFTLWPLVRELPPRQRAVIVLRYMADLKESEIAEAMDCAPGTVKSTASAALKNLRARLDETGDPTSTRKDPS